MRTSWAFCPFPPIGSVASVEGGRGSEFCKAPYLAVLHLLLLFLTLVVSPCSASFRGLHGMVRHLAKHSALSPPRTLLSRLSVSPPPFCKACSCLLTPSSHIFTAPLTCLTTTTICSLEPADLEHSLLVVGRRRTGGGGSMLESP